LLILFRLAARLAAFRSRIAAFLEERLILACKREVLPAVAAGHLLIRCHKTLSYVRSQLADIAGTYSVNCQVDGCLSNEGNIAH
jgi:hypothetical protein